MKVYIKTILVITIVIFIFTGCSLFTPTLEKPKKHFQVKIEQAKTLNYPDAFSSEITYISDEKLLRFSNEENDQGTMIANIYAFSLSGSSEHLITFEGVYIKEIVYFNSKFFVSVRKGIDDGADMTLICMDENWSEVWRYEAKKVFGRIHPLNNVIALTIFPREVKNEEYKVLEDEVILFNMDGKIQNSKKLNKYERITYMTYMEKEDSIYVIIIMKVKTFHPPYELQKWTQDMELISTVELPFTILGEWTQDIVNIKDENLLITDRNVYTIGNQNVTKRLDIYPLYKKHLGKKGYLEGNEYINYQGKDFHYLGILNDQQYETIPILISFNEDFTNASLRYLDITGDILCAFKTKDGKVTVIQDIRGNEEGVLDICQWEEHKGK